MQGTRVKIPGLRRSHMVWGSCVPQLLSPRSRGHELRPLKAACPRAMSMRACQVASVVSDSLWPHELQPVVPLSVGFFRQEYWSRSPGPSPGDLPNPGIEPVSLISPALAGGLFTTSMTWEAQRRGRFLANFGLTYISTVDLHRVAQSCLLCATYNNKYYLWLKTTPKGMCCHNLE